MSRTVPRTAALAALAVAALAVVAAVALWPSGDYTVRARFVNAGQLVNGDLVTVGGHQVGTVSDMRLTSDGLAEVQLRLDGDASPLRRGTIATIRAVGLSGVANRFVDLAPGPPGAPAIPDGGVIGMTRTRPIVDLDAVLDAFDPATRSRLQRILREGAGSFAGVARPANRAFALLDPALSQTARVGDELVRDQAAFQRLVASYATVARSIASRGPELESGVQDTAAVLRALASRTTELQDALARSPAVLRRGAGTLRRAGRTLEVVPAATPLVRLLRALGPVTRGTRPIVTDLQSALPSLRRSLEQFPALAREVVPSVRDTTDAVRGALPVFAALRPYAPDFVNGFFNGFGGAIGGYYDANGQYARIAPLAGAGVGQGIASLFTQPPDAGSLIGYRKGLVARCPGGASEPAPDGSNPFVDDPALCVPAQDHR